MPLGQQNHYARTTWLRRHPKHRVVQRANFKRSRSALKNNQIAADGRPKRAPAKAGVTSPRGNCVPPCRATASPSHRTRPPLWACGPPPALRRSAPPAQHPKLEISTGRVGLGEENQAFLPRRIAQARLSAPLEGVGQGFAGFAACDSFCASRSWSNVELPDADRCPRLPVSPVRRDQLSPPCPTRAERRHDVQRSVRMFRLRPEIYEPLHLARGVIASECNGRGRPECQRTRDGCGPRH